MIFKNRKSGETVDVAFRSFHESDAAAIGACLREAYGDTYVHKEFYSEQAVLDEYRDGKAVFTIAEASGGETAGIVCGMYSGVFGRQCEMACQVILHKFRNFNISLAQLEYETEFLKKENCASLYANVLAVHTRSQQTVEKIGFVSCGFLLNVFDKSKFVAEYDVKNPKTSQTIVTYPLSKKDVGTLYCDDGLREIVDGVYDRLGVKFKLSDLNEKISGDNDEITIEYDELHKTLTVYAYGIGSETLGKIINSAEKHSNEKLFTANVFINMCDKAAASLYGGLKSSGYFFTGLHPLSEKGEFLIMHNPMNTDFSLSDIKYIASQSVFAEKINSQAKEYSYEQKGN